MTLTAIETLLSQRIGIDASIIGSRKISKVVDKRLSACGLSNIETYLKLLQTSPQEFEELVEQIVVPETWFFRDRKSFDFLINFVRSEWLPKFCHTKLRVLSVPCSSGEEPYSIAIALMEAGLRTDRFSIDAIDISKHAIAKAQQAIYSKNSFRGEEFVERNRYFQQTAEGFEVLPSIRSQVTFRQSNILSAFSVIQAKYNVIFCRNLLIYLKPSTCTQVLNLVERLLLPNGLLFVGSSETGKIKSDRFTPIRQSFTFAYCKVESSQLPIQKIELKKDKHIQLNKFNQKPIRHLSSCLKKTPTASTISYTKTQSTIHQPNITQPHENLHIAKKLADEGQVEVAIHYCKQYLESEQTSAEAHVLLGTLYQAKTEYNQAERCFQKALYLNPNCYEALMQLALLKEYRGDLVSASILQQRIQKLRIGIKE
ncbi:MULTISPECIES: CheR family methyltransferase [Nostocales]|uniref:Tetratricopeptide repeat protein n=3 Tax=Nostocales TaxID=1161 RepID=A0A0C1N1Y4_9CYAN|nr:CheR family methyltransferase [Tolypothrix bouteillei]KAF3883821.1 tetratricopeptide repeat protein [Tolypothrix bouteillei VB521301]